MLQPEADELVLFPLAVQHAVGFGLEVFEFLLKDRQDLRRVIAVDNRFNVGHGLPPPGCGLPGAFRNKDD